MFLDRSLAGAEGAAEPRMPTWRTTLGKWRRSRKPFHSISATFVCGMLAGSDGLAVTAAGLLAFLVYAGPAVAISALVTYATLSVVGGAGTVCLASAVKLYRPDVLETPFLRPWHAVGCWGAMVLLMLGTVFFFHAEATISRAWVGMWVFYGAGFLGLVRIVMRAKLAWWRACGWMRRRVAVVGVGAAVASLAERLRQPDLADYYEVMTIPGENEGAGDKPVAAETLVAFVRDRAIETVIISLAAGQSPAVNQLGLALAELPVEVLLWPDSDLFALPVMRAHRVGGLSLLQVSRAPLNDWSRIIKGLEDRIVSGAMLLFFAPVMLLAALAIRLDSPGPVMFRQKRYGFNNRPISVLKFRTMYTQLGDATGAARTVRGDKRVTRVGSILRKTSVDELPQLINVLRGEMSLVGPRAHPVMMTVAGQLYHEAVQGYGARHRVKPGITGLAQINGSRGEVVTMEQARARIHYDLEYVARWSLWLDVKIMLLTPLRALHKAY